MAAHGEIVVAELSEQTLPVNPANGFGGFTFGDFAASGAVSYTADSVILDIANDADGVNGLFGGVGVDFGTPTTIAGIDLLLPIDFDPSVSRFELRVKKLQGNAAGIVNMVMRDVDDLITNAREEWQYNFDLTGVPDDGEFHLVTVPATVTGFRRTDSGAPDEIINPGLGQLQFQSAFGATDRLHIEIDFGRVVTIPEPASLLLVALSGLAALSRR
ncbi:MAG: hypothetical protein RIC11_06145 [Botrimarina sp.]